MIHKYVRCAFAHIFSVKIWTPQMQRICNGQEEWQIKMCCEIKSYLWIILLFVKLYNISKSVHLAVCNSSTHAAFYVTLLFSNVSWDRLCWWWRCVCDVCCSCWRTSVRSSETRGSVRWTCEGRTSPPASRPSPCPDSSSWATSWTTAALRTAR